MLGGMSVATPLTVSRSSPAVLFDATCTLDVAPTLAFDYIADHAGLPRWIPGLRSVSVDESASESPGGVGTRRILRAIAGPPGTEVVTAFDRPLRLAYRATDESLRGLCTSHNAELRCRPHHAGCEIQWTVTAMLPDALWRRVAARLVFYIVYGLALRNLRARLRQ